MIRRVLVLLAVFALSAAPVAAQTEVLQVIPDDAIGFALVNRLTDTDQKITALAKRMKIEVPGNPLAMVKGALGVEKGLAEKGTLAIAAFASKVENGEPRPLLVIPVSDYQAFIGQFEPDDAKAAISAIKLKDGKAMLAGKRGSFALLTAADDRDLLERALKANKTLAAATEPLSAWLAESDAAGVLTAHGIKLMSLKIREGLDQAKLALQNLPPEAQGVGKFFDAIESFLKSAETDVTHAGMALRVDEPGNLHLTSRVRFAAGSGFAKAGGSIKGLTGGPLAGLPSGPFVLALGAVLPGDAMKAMLDMNLQLMKAADPNITEETLKKLAEAYAGTMKGLRGMGFVWQVGKDNQPAFASLAATMHTDNAAAYMADYEKSVVAMKDIFKDIQAPFAASYDLKKVSVNGKPVLELSMDFGAGLGVPPEVEKILKTMVGPDGKMKVSLAARDDKTIVMRYTAADGLKELLSGPELGGDASIAQVTKALPPGAQWALYLSPKGLIDFADRMIKEFSPIPINLPQFAATPPVGIGARVSGQGFDLNIVVPAPVVDNVGNFVDQLKRMFQGAV